MKITEDKNGQPFPACCRNLAHGDRAPAVYYDTDRGNFYCTEGCGQGASYHRAVSNRLPFVSYTAAIYGGLGHRECGPTTYERAVEQLRDGEARVDVDRSDTTRAMLYGNDAQGQRTLLAEYRSLRSRAQGTR